MIHCGLALLWWGFLDLQQLLVGMELRVLEYHHSHKKDYNSVSNNLLAEGIDTFIAFY